MKTPELFGVRINWQTCGHETFALFAKQEDAAQLAAAYDYENPAKVKGAKFALGKPEQFTIEADAPLFEVSHTSYYDGGSGDGSDLRTVEDTLKSLSGTPLASFTATSLFEAAKGRKVGTMIATRKYRVPIRAGQDYGRRKYWHVSIRLSYAGTAAEYMQRQNKEEKAA